MRSGASQVRRLLAVATISGFVGLAVASLFDLPGTAVLAIWVGLWAVVPIFGPIVGYAPLVVLASLDGWPNAIGVVVLAGLIAVASWYADRHVYSWDIRSTGRRTGPFGLTVALVVGLQFGWLIGPLVAIFLMAAAVSTLAALGARHRPAEIRVAGRPAGGPRRVVRRRPVVSSWSHLDVRSAAMATSIVVIVVVVIALVVDLSPVPAWIVIGIVLAMALDPLVEWLTDHTVLGRGRGGRRRRASACWRSWRRCSCSPSRRSSTASATSTTSSRRSPPISKQLPLIGDELAERGVADRLQTTLEEAPDRLASDTGPTRAHVALDRRRSGRHVLDPAHHGDRH